MSSAIDLDVLRATLKREESMVRYYTPSTTKLAQNAALEAAGLPPIHNTRAASWDAQQREVHQRAVEVLQAVIAHFEGESAQEAA